MFEFLGLRQSIDSVVLFNLLLIRSGKSLPFDKLKIFHGIEIALNVVSQNHLCMFYIVIVFVNLPLDYTFQGIVNYPAK